MRVCNLHASFSSCPCQTQSGGSSIVGNVVTLTQTGNCSLQTALHRYFSFPNCACYFMLLKLWGFKLPSSSLSVHGIREGASMLRSNCLNEGKTSCTQCLAKSFFLLGGKRTLKSYLANDLYLGRDLMTGIPFLFLQSSLFWKHGVQEVSGFSASWMKGMEPRDNATVF